MIKQELLKHLSPREKKAVEEFINGISKIFNQNLLKIILYGSKAEGDFSHDSDIDILLIVEKIDLSQRKAFFKFLVDIELQYDSHISPVLVSKKEYEMNKKMGSFFFHEIEKKGIVLQ